MRLEARLGEPDQADEGRVSADLDRPEPPTPLGNQPACPSREGVALLAGERAREAAHHLRIGIQRGERLEVGLAPLPEHEPLRLQRQH